MQGAQFRARVGAEAVGEAVSYVLVGRQRLRGAARVAQGAQPQGLERLVQGVAVAQRGQFGQRLLGPAEGEGGGEAGAPGVQAAGLPAGRLGAAVGEVGEGRAAPQREGVVEEGGGLGRVAVGQRPGALRREPLEAVQVDVVGRGAQPVAAARPRRPRRAPSARRSRPTSACSAPAASAGGSPPHTSSTSTSAGTVRPGRSASTVSRARSRAPPTGTGVPSARSAWVVPRMR